MPPLAKEVLLRFQVERTERQQARLGAAARRALGRLLLVSCGRRRSRLDQHRKHVLESSPRAAAAPQSRTTERGLQDDSPPSTALTPALRAVRPNTSQYVAREHRASVRETNQRSLTKSSAPYGTLLNESPSEAVWTATATRRGSKSALRHVAVKGGGETHSSRQRPTSCAQRASLRAGGASVSLVSSGVPLTCPLETSRDRATHHNQCRRCASRRCPRRPWSCTCRPSSQRSRRPTPWRGCCSSWTCRSSAGSRCLLREGRRRVSMADSEWCARTARRLSPRKSSRAARGQRAAF